MELITETIPFTAPDGVSTMLNVAGPVGANGALLIHGVLHSRHIWKQQFADPGLGGLRLAAYDIRGHGAADMPKEAHFYEPAKFADEVATAIKVSGIRRPVLVGWSLGTRMAFNYLDHHGFEDVSGLMLVGARAFQRVQPRNAGQEALFQACSSDLDTRIRARLRFIHATYGTELSAADAAEIAAHAMLPIPEALVHFAGRSMDYEELLAKLPFPVRAILGSDDQVVPPDEIARLPIVRPQIEMVQYDGIGHAPFYHAPQRFSADLREFVLCCGSAQTNGSSS